MNAVRHYTFLSIDILEKVREVQILKRILTRSPLDEDMSAKVCQVARNAYRDYWYRKKLMEKVKTILCIKKDNTMWSPA